mgnify:CR=1 FL=1
MFRRPDYILITNSKKIKPEIQFQERNYNILLLVFFSHLHTLFTYRSMMNPYGSGITGRLGLSWLFIVALSFHGRNHSLEPLAV